MLRHRPAPPNPYDSSLIREPLGPCVSDELVARMQLADTERSVSNGGRRDLVYDVNECAASNARQPMNHKIDHIDDLVPYYTPTNAADDTLQFESRFESGNLGQAYRVGDNEYDLYLSPDTNTKGHTQWYYFSVSNTRKGASVKVNIVNLMKPDSLYNYGMRPLSLSTTILASDGVGWRRSGRGICYYNNGTKRRSSLSYYTLTFTHDFTHDHDTVYFCHCYPYTKSDLTRYLDGLELNPRIRQHIRRRALCRTISGDLCDVITISSFAKDPETLRKRKGIVVSARVHPGETNSSWMMKGVLDYLTADTPDAKLLRDHFVFKIVPMVNPDGVVLGNYRTNLSGHDLNRQWLHPGEHLHPTIHHLKTAIGRFVEDRDVVMFCDLHGHSRKKNIFIYGCNNSSTKDLRLQERVFPRLLWANAPSFSFDDCSFRVQRSKDSTARVVVWRSFSVMNAFTMEASFCGPSYGRDNGIHFSQRSFEEMGHYLCETILDYCDPDPARVQRVVSELEEMYPVEPTDGEMMDDSDYSDEDGKDGDGRKGEKKGKKKKEKKGKKMGKKKGKKGKSASASSVKKPVSRPSSEAGEASSRSTVDMAPLPPPRSMSAMTLRERPKSKRVGKKKVELPTGLPK